MSGKKFVEFTKIGGPDSSMDKSVHVRAGEVTYVESVLVFGRQGTLLIVDGTDVHVVESVNYVLGELMENLT